MKHPFAILLPALAAAGILGSGCVAIPMGTEKFTTEYPADIRPTDAPPAKTYEVNPTVLADDEDHRTVTIGLIGKVTSEQLLAQHYKAVSLDKRKRLAIGLCPQLAQTRMYHPKGALTPVGSMAYNGDGNYASYNLKTDDNVLTAQKKNNQAGAILSLVTLGLVSTPIVTIAEMFGPFEKDEHFLGGNIDSYSSKLVGQSIYSTTVYDSKDIDLLRKFPKEARDKIGAWTYFENTEHPHHSFWRGFSSIQYFGVYKYCNYFVKDEGELQRTTPAPPRITTQKRIASGPYSVMLSLPALGFSQTASVETERTNATFDLLDVANGDSFANGTVRFLPPPGGLAVIRNEDDRALLELAMEKEWPVTVALPAPRIGTVPQHRSENATSKSPAPRTAPYQISSIEPKDGMLVVRVTVNDASQTFDIDRTVQPEVRRMFREQFATGPDAKRRESVRMAVEDGGKSLVYTVTFE